MATENPPGSEDLVTHVAAAADRVLRLPLLGAGFAADPERGWTWSDRGAFVGVAVRVVGRSSSGGSGSGGVAMTFGWRFDAFGDPPPVPASAEGCVRQLSIDDFVADSGSRLASLPDAGALAQWEQRLATTFRKQIAGWVETWKRPEGFRDFVSDRRLHLAAAWLSAALGQRERVDLELRSAAALQHVPLVDGFDRRRADRDEAFAAPLAARHGLAAFLREAEARGDHQSLDSFGGARDALARDRVTEPDLEHARLVRRHEVYAALCLQHGDAMAVTR